MNDTDKTATGVIETDDRTQVVLRPESETTQYAANVECPVCKTPNPPSETYCIDCGFLLGSEPPVIVEAAETPSAGMLVTPDGTREFPLKPGENTVGRENADVLLTHNTVSRKHARITVTDGRALLEDLGSTNGTRVEGQKLSAGEPVELTDGCEIEFGSAVLKYRTPKETDQTQEPAIPEAESEEPRIEESETETRVSGEEETEQLPERIPVARLVSKDGSLAYDLYEGMAAVGRRQSGNDIVIPDPYVSGRHADILVEGAAFTITDVGSTNGTLVNGTKLEPNVPHQVQPGDEITIGQTVFVIEVAG